MDASDVEKSLSGGQSNPQPESPPSLTGVIASLGKAMEAQTALMALLVQQQAAFLEMMSPDDVEDDAEEPAVDMEGNPIRAGV